MTVPRELEVKILRVFAVEKWPIGTIATQLGVHHEVVERVLRQASAPSATPTKPTLIDPYVEFVREQWSKFPTLTASRIWHMCRERGYQGAKDHFRSLVAPYRPRPRGEAFLRLKTFIGEQAQVDWAHCGSLTVGRATRPLVAFVCVLSYSRAIFVRFFLGQQGENFLRGHVEAFERWGGVPRVVLYDNLKSAVLERKGDAIQLNPLLLEFVGRYHFEARPVAPYRGNEKARVERAIRYLRTAFFPGRSFREGDLADRNAQVDAWCAGEVLDRPCPEEPTRTVREVLAEEKARLLPLPADPFPLDERCEVRAGKTPYVRFDKNDYSVPHTCARKTLTVLASQGTVRVLDGPVEVARHDRSYDKGHTAEAGEHVAALKAEKHRAREHRGLDHLTSSAPSTRDLLKVVAEHGGSPSHASRQLLVLLDEHGAQALEAAVRAALAAGSLHVHGVRQILERERAARGTQPLAVSFPKDPRLEFPVHPHDLGTYDQLGSCNKAASHDT